ncbi:MAG: glutathione transferase [Phormidesmis sp.]
MPANDFTLYADSKLISPYVMSAFVALTEKGLSFDLQKIDLQAQEHQQAAYVRISRSRRVPTLVQENFQLSESSAIAEYLEEQFPPLRSGRLYPSDLKERAKAREIQAWLRSDLMAIRTERPTEVIFFEPVDTPLSTAAVAAADKLFAATEALLSADSVNLFSEWCIADTDLAVMLNRLVSNGDEVPKRLKAYVQRQWQRPAVQLWIQQSR